MEAGSFIHYSKTKNFNCMKAECLHLFLMLYNHLCSNRTISTGFKKYCFLYLFLDIEIIRKKKKSTKVLIICVYTTLFLLMVRRYNIPPICRWEDCIFSLWRCIILAHCHLSEADILYKVMFNKEQQGIWREMFFSEVFVSLFQF